MLALTSCSAIKNNSSYDIPADSKEVFVDLSTNTQDDGDRTTISRVEVVGDFISLSVNYSGGCEEHIFDLISTGEFTATYPPEVELVLRHNANNDKCRSYVDERLFFDLKPLQYDGTNRIAIRLLNTDKLYEYNY